MKKTNALLTKKYLLTEPLANQEGMILIISLMLLVVLTLMATTAMQMSNLEQSIATSSEVYQHNFYALEAAAIEAIVEIESETDQNLFDHTPTWLAQDTNHFNPTLLNDPLYQFNFKISSRWNTGGSIDPNETSLNSGTTNIRPADYGAGDRIRYAAIDTGISLGSSLSTPGEQTHTYAVYSVYDVDTGTSYPGRMILTMGHKKKLNL